MQPTSIWKELQEKRKELETLIIACREIIKHQKMKCGIDKACKLLQDFLEEKIFF